jgi:hypothetical protein
MSQSIQYQIEDGIAALLTGISRLNVYTTNRIGRRLFPYVSIQASINSQVLGNYSGVYDLSVAVNYSDTAAKTTQEAFDQEYCEIFEAFYSETPTLRAKIDAQIAAPAVIYMAQITGQTPTIRTTSRAWQRGLTMRIMASPVQSPQAAAYVAALQFNDHRNSQYIGAI